MNESKRRAWASLGMGPVWRLKASGQMPQATPEAGERGDQSDGVPAAGMAGLDWAGLRQTVSGCQACGLCEGRQNTVFGVGDESARWMVIGEAPGAEEDRSGEPFVGRAGKLLDSMLGAVDLDRQRGVFIANVLKCRPPGNRNPEPGEVARCFPYLQRQIELVEPRLILALGKFAAHALLDTDASIASLRGRVHRYRSGNLDIPVVVTYHPAYLLRAPLEKARAWEDLVLAVRSSSVSLLADE